MIVRVLIVIVSSSFSLFCDLKAIIVHEGSDASSGLYFADIRPSDKSETKWKRYACFDVVPSKVACGSFRGVQSTAYMLVYARVNSEH